MTTMTHRGQETPYEFRRLLLGVPATVGLVRDHTATQLKKWGLGYLVEEAALVASELMTNAVKVAPGRLIGFELYLVPDALMIEITDPVEAPPRLQQPALNSICGRGLVLVEACTDGWGVRRPPGSEGKVVWARMCTRVT